MTHCIGKRGTRVKYRVFRYQNAIGTFWAVVLDHKNGLPLGRPFMYAKDINKLWRMLADRERRIACNHKVLVPSEQTLREYNSEGGRERVLLRLARSY